MRPLAPLRPQSQPDRRLGINTLGIGVNATVFTLPNAVLFKGFPFDKSDRILYMRERNATLALLTTHSATLEDVFVALTGRHLRDG